MRFEVVDRDQRLVVDQRDGLGGGQPDDHAADQAGSGGRRNAVELAIAAAGLFHRLRDHMVQHLDMGAGGDLRHHAAEVGVFADLRQHDIGQDLAAAVGGALDHRRGGLVAGRFDAEHDHRFAFPAGQG